MLTAQEIVDRIGATMKGQLLLFSEPDDILRQTPFSATGDKEFDRAWLIHWWMHTYNPEASDPLERVEYGSVYKSYSNAIYKYFNYTMLSLGSWVGSNQQAVTLTCYKHEPTDDHVAELNLWLPHIRPRMIPDPSLPFRKNGAEISLQCIKLMEESLSYYGIFYIVIYHLDNPVRYKLIFGRGSSNEIRCDTTSIEELVDYTKKHHYYEKHLKKTQNLKCS